MIKVYIAIVQIICLVFQVACEKRNENTGASGFLLVNILLMIAVLFIK